jgi:hypothetical protein
MAPLRGAFLQKAVALDARARQRTFSLADAQRFGLQDAGQLHRPGWRFNATADAVEATHEREAAHVEYLLRLRDAYKSPPPYGREVTGAGSSGPRGEREGDSVCVPDRSHQDAMTMDEVYRAYDLEILQRWRTP